MTFDEQVEAYAHRHGWPLAKARQRAGALIANEVELALRGAGRFDRMPVELEAEARRRFEDRLRAGEGVPGVARMVASTGGRLP